MAANTKLIEVQVVYNKAADRYAETERSGDFQASGDALEALVIAEDSLIDVALEHVAIRYPNHPALRYVELVRQSARRNTLIDLALGLDVYEPIAQPKRRRR